MRVKPCVLQAVVIDAFCFGMAPQGFRWSTLTVSVRPVIKEIEDISAENVVALFIRSNDRLWSD